MLNRFFSRIAVGQPVTHDAEPSPNVAVPAALTLSQVYKAVNALNTRQPSFEERLAACQHGEYHLTHFLDPIDYLLVNDPVMINGVDSHTTDKRTLLGLKKAANPFTNLPIFSVSINSSRLAEIEKFVSLVEKITELKNKIADITTKQNQIAAIPDSITYSRTLIGYASDLMKAKIELRDKLQQFIDFSKSIINATDITQVEREEEFNNIVAKKESELSELEHEVDQLKHRYKSLPTFIAELKALDRTTAMITALEQNVDEIKQGMLLHKDGISAQSKAAVNVLTAQSKLLLASQNIDAALEKFITNVDQALQSNHEQEQLSEEMSLILAEKRKELMGRQESNNATAKYYFMLQKFLDEMNQITALENEITNQQNDLTVLIESLKQDHYPIDEIEVIYKDNQADIHAKQYHLYLAIDQFIHDFNNLLDTNHTNKDEITYILLNMQRKIGKLSNEIKELVEPKNVAKASNFKQMIDSHINLGLQSIAGSHPFHQIVSIPKGVMLFAHQPRFINTNASVSADNHYSAPRPGGNSEVD